MSIRLTKSLLAKMESQVQKREATRSSVWFQTAGGDMFELEFELAWQSRMICDKLDFGVGFARSNPICLPPKVTTNALESIRQYFRFYQTADHSDEECDLFDNEFLNKDTHTLCMLAHAAKCLELEGLVDLICDTLAANTDNSSPKSKQDYMKYFEKSVEEEELVPQKNPNGDSRIRLSNKLLEKQKKEFQEVKNVKKAEAEVEVQKLEDRSIDDLVSFINGGAEETKGVQTMKKKKKRNRNSGKEKKKISSKTAFSSSKTSASTKVNENREVIHASANHSSSAADSLKVWGTQVQIFDVADKTVDNDLDPERMKEIDREVEEFARSLDLINKAGIQAHMELYQ